MMCVTICVCSLYVLLRESYFKYCNVIRYSVIRVDLISLPYLQQFTFSYLYTLPKPIDSTGHCCERHQRVRSTVPATYEAKKTAKTQNYGKKASLSRGEIHVVCILSIGLTQSVKIAILSSQRNPILTHTPTPPALPRRKSAAMRVRAGPVPQQTTENQDMTQRGRKTRPRWPHLCSVPAQRGLLSEVRLGHGAQFAIASP